MQGWGAEGMWKCQQLGKRSSLEAEGNCTKTLRDVHCRDVCASQPYFTITTRTVAFVASVSSELHMVALLTWSWPALMAAEPLLPGSLGSWTTAGNSGTDPGYVNRLPILLPKTLDVVDYREEKFIRAEKWNQNSIQVLTKENFFLAGRNSFVCL